jgi:hypothetical protein
MPTELETLGSELSKKYDLPSCYLRYCGDNDCGKCFVGDACRLEHKLPRLYYFKSKTSDRAAICIAMGEFWARRTITRNYFEFTDEDASTCECLGETTLPPSRTLVYGLSGDVSPYAHGELHIPAYNRKD